MRRFFGGGKPTRFKKNDLVELSVSGIYPNLPAGSIGMVTRVLAEDGPSYEVEFIDARGATLDRLTVQETHLSPVENA